MSPASRRGEENTHPTSHPAARLTSPSRGISPPAHVFPSRSLGFRPRVPGSEIPGTLIRVERAPGFVVGLVVAAAVGSR